MHQHAAMLNIQLQEGLDPPPDIEEWSAFLRRAAFDGYAKEVVVRFDSERQLLQVVVPYTDDGLHLLEAGAVLGYCLARVESVRTTELDTAWLSILGRDGMPRATIL